MAKDQQSSPKKKRRSSRDFIRVNKSSPYYVYAVVIALLALIWTLSTRNWIQMLKTESQVLEVFIYSVIGMLVTGLGAFPFWLVDFNNFSKKYVGIANAIAAGVMIAASVGLVHEGISTSEDLHPFKLTALGIFTGLIAIHALDLYLNKSEFDIGHLHGANARKAFLVLAIMTLHSFAEGMGVGLSFWGSKGSASGRAISLAIAVHNIPEGLAIALVLLPKGESILMTTLYCILSSAPQPLISIPSFLLVQYVRMILPFGLGAAAGAMFWLSITELLPESAHALKSRVQTGFISICAMILMFSFQSWIHALESLS
jgi:zinc transporter, ZIP family